MGTGKCSGRSRIPRTSVPPSSSRITHEIAGHGGGPAKMFDICRMRSVALDGSREGLLPVGLIARREVVGTPLGDPQFEGMMR